MTGSSARRTVGAAIAQRKLGQDPADHVPHVGETFLKEFVLDLIEQRGILVEHLVQRRAGIDAVIEDGRPHLADQRRIAQQQPMGAKDRGRRFAKLAADALDDGVELLRGSVARVLETADLVGKAGRIDLLRIARRQHFVHTIGPRDGHAGRYGNPFQHVAHFTRGFRRGQSNGTGEPSGVSRRMAAWRAERRQPPGGARCALPRW